MRKHLIYVVVITMSLSACNLQNAPASTPSVTVAPSPSETIAPTELPQIIVTTTPISDTSPTSLPVASPISAVTATTQGIVPIGVRTTTPIAITSTATPVGQSSPDATATVQFPETFPETYDVPLNAGNTLLVNYDVTLSNPGSGFVFIVVVDPSGVEADRLAISDTVQDTLEVPVDASGTYQIRVAFQNLRGNYSVSYGFR